MNTQNESEDLYPEIELEAKLASAKASSSPLGGSFEGGLGGSPISQLKQDQLVAMSYIKANLKDTDGCLHQVLESKLKSSDTLFSQQLEHPLTSLGLFIEAILNSEIEEITRQADMAYGQQYGERPIFQKPGESAKAHDPYTHQSVSQDLKNLLIQVQKMS